MADILLTAVLPIFAFAAFGFIASRTKLFDLTMAAVINRFVLYFSLPALSFNLLATNYNVRVDAIAEAILFSMVASILSVSLIAAQ